MITKAQAQALTLVNANDKLREFARAKIDGCIKAASEHGNSTANRTSVLISFWYGDDGVVLASVFQEYTDAGYVVSAENIFDSSIRVRAVSWA